MIRLFAAVPMPTEIGEALSRRQEGVPGARWRLAETLHLTLRFAGEIAETSADDWHAALAALRGVAFELRLVGMGAFNEGREIASLWAGVEDSPALRRLARGCETAARRAGLPANKRAWKPHVTLAYLKRADPARVAAWIQGHNLLRSPPFPVTSFGLYSSRPGTGGSSYRLERSYPLTVT